MVLWCEVERVWWLVVPLSASLVKWSRGHSSQVVTAYVVLLWRVCVCVCVCVCVPAPRYFRYRLRVSDQPDVKGPVQAAGGLCVWTGRDHLQSGLLLHQVTAHSSASSSSSHRDPGRERLLHVSNHKWNTYWGCTFRVLKANTDLVGWLNYKIRLFATNVNRSFLTVTLFWCFLAGGMPFK